jgi:outer membrane protein TolC
MVARAWFLATEARPQKGITDEAEASLATYRDAVQRLGLALRHAAQTLETLVGRYPSAELEIPLALPGPVPTGLPSELLERRPAVVATERRVAAAFYRVEEIKAARFPSISLTGSFSSLSSDLVVLKERDDPVWGFGSRATVPLYLGGSLQAEVAVRTAEQKEAVAAYGRAGANAFADVENALSTSFALDARRPLLKQAVTESERALTLAETRYRVGSDDLRAVEQQQLRLLGAKSALVRVESEQLVQRVNLHLALGGNFSPAGT